MSEMPPTDMAARTALITNTTSSMEVSLCWIDVRYAGKVATERHGKLILVKEIVGRPEMSPLSRLQVRPDG